MKTDATGTVASRRWLQWSIGILLLCAVAGTYPKWWPQLNGWIDQTVASTQGPKSDAGHDEHGHDHDEHAEEGHDHDAEHDHAGHSESTSLELTTQSLKNLGLTLEYLKPIALSNFYRTVTIPAIVTAKPGRTEIQVSSPMSGIVQHVHAVSGETVVPGDMLFEVRLTYEDLVDTQTELLKNLADLEVEQREVARLQEVTQSGAVASKLLLERQYAFQKLQSSIAAQRAALKLHGLTDEQVETITREKRLLRDLTIVAPGLDIHEHEDDPLRLSSRPARFAGTIVNDSVPEIPLGTPTPLIVERLTTSKGQGVKAGEVLCTLSDYSALYIEGKAFEQDAPAIAEVAAKGWPITALVPGVSSLKSSLTCDCSSWPMPSILRHERCHSSLSYLIPSCVTRSRQMVNALSRGSIAWGNDLKFRCLWKRGNNRSSCRSTRRLKTAQTGSSFNKTEIILTVSRCM